MKTIGIKSLIIGVLLTSVIFLGASDPVAPPAEEAPESTLLSSFIVVALPFVFIFGGVYLLMRKPMAYNQEVTKRGLAQNDEIISLLKKIG